MEKSSRTKKRKRESKTHSNRGNKSPYLTRNGTLWHFSTVSYEWISPSGETEGVGRSAEKGTRWFLLRYERSCGLPRGWVRGDKRTRRIDKKKNERKMKTGWRNGPVLRWHGDRLKSVSLKKFSRSGTASSSSFIPLARLFSGLM